jgi:hypothetical protein
VNNFALVGYMLTLAATVALAMHWPRIEPAAFRKLVRALAAVVIVYWPLQFVLVSGRFGEIWSRIRNIDDNQQEAVYDFARAHPGVIYFPWNNLATLLAEGKLYHFEWGIVDRYYSRYPLTSEQVLQHIPSNTQALAVGPYVQSFNTLRLFTDMTAQLPARDDLPGFIIVGAPGTTLPAPAPSSAAWEKQP